MPSRHIGKIPYQPRQVLISILAFDKMETLFETYSFGMLPHLS